MTRFEEGDHAILRPDEKDVHFQDLDGELVEVLGVYRDTYDVVRVVDASRDRMSERLDTRVVSVMHDNLEEPND